MKLFEICVIFILLNTIEVGSVNVTTTYSQCRFDQCIAIRKCNSILNLLRRGNLTPDERTYLSRSQCGWNDNQPLVCCPDKQIKEPPVESVLPSTKSCGKSITYHIFLGIEAHFEEQLWNALLQYSKPNNEKGFHCGGALISERYVLTAAHCVNGKQMPSTWILTAVRLGEHVLSTEFDTAGDDSRAVDVSITEKITHEHYDPHSINQINDIALLRLENHEQFPDYVYPICLPLTPSVDVNYDGQRIFDVVGWGSTETNLQSDIRLIGTLQNIPISQCNQMYNGTGILLQDTQICATSTDMGNETCRGDSGGPLIAAPSNEWYVFGVSSFGSYPCGDNDRPNVFTKVSSFIDWIKAKVYG